MHLGFLHILASVDIYDYGPFHGVKLKVHHLEVGCQANKMHSLIVKQRRVAQATTSFELVCVVQVLRTTRVPFKLMLREKPSNDFALNKCKQQRTFLHLQLLFGKEREVNLHIFHGHTSGFFLLWQLTYSDTYAIPDEAKLPNIAP